VAQCPVTFFESTTAMALLAFARHEADVVLLETGMGGRLDATNVVARPRLTAITPVGMDHMEFLGNDLAAIAAEKAGILKQGVACVVGPQREETLRVIMERAAVVGAPLSCYGDDWQVAEQAAGIKYHSSRGDMLLPRPALVGAHQMNNAATAVACIEQLTELSITAEHIANGLSACQWPARLQLIKQNAYAALLPPQSELWLDGGHNADAGQVLAAWVRQQQQPVHLVCGMMARKDVQGFLQPLAGNVASLVAIAVPDEEDSCSAEMIRNVAAGLGMRAATAASPRDALAHIARDASDAPYAVLICGSLYLAGKILSGRE
jgi:dihydrofolate synthase/folylpolyglutamate synthase